MEPASASSVDAYLGLVRAVHELACVGDLSPEEADVLCDVADARLFGEPTCEQALVTAEVVFDGLMDARVLSPLEIAAMRELLWAIEPVLTAPPATPDARPAPEPARDGPAAA